jgi:protein-S-isoprenylcysteine O-methyltransferase Ste14
MNPEKNPVRRPATLIPPPLVYALALWLAWEAEKLSAWSFSPWPLTGWLLVVAGLGLLAWAVIAMARHKTTVNPYAGVSTLVERGPFRFSRNPIYLGDTAIYFGVMLLWGTLWPLLFYPAVWWAIRHGVIANEEAHLRARFGAAYEAYCARVRRWL